MPSHERGQLQRRGVGRRTAAVADRYFHPPVVFVILDYLEDEGMKEKLSDWLIYAAVAVVMAPLATLVFGVIFTMNGARKMQGDLPLLYAMGYYFGANQGWIVPTSITIAVLVVAASWFGRK